ncbi:MAG: hypothetical protein MRY83_06010 [Flavobacteriales bacterium]|nr:hypothetical protein [Flavobacteriales bacterium]
MTYFEIIQTAKEEYFQVNEELILLELSEEGEAIKFRSVVFEDGELYHIIEQSLRLLPYSTDSFDESRFEAFSAAFFKLVSEKLNAEFDPDLAHHVIVENYFPDILSISDLNSVEDFYQAYKNDKIHATISALSSSSSFAKAHDLNALTSEQQLGFKEILDLEEERFDSNNRAIIESFAMSGSLCQSYLKHLFEDWTQKDIGYLGGLEDTMNYKIAQYVLLSEGLLEDAAFYADLKQSILDRGCRL